MLVETLSRGIWSNRVCMSSRQEIRNSHLAYLTLGHGSSGSVTNWVGRSKAPEETGLPLS